MTPRALRALKRIRSAKENRYDARRIRGGGYLVPAGVTAEDVELLASLGIALDEVRTFEHDTAVTRLRSALSELTPEEVGRGFVASLSGSWLRGVQPFATYHRMRLLPAHTHVPGFMSQCAECGLGTRDDQDALSLFARCYLGGFGTNTSLYAAYMVFDLEEYLSQRSTWPSPSERDFGVLRSLLVTAAGLPADATPGALEKRLAAQRTLPKTNKHRRAVILDALASAGILPNTRCASPSDAWLSHHDWCEASGDTRAHLHSDIDWPLAAWRGRLGVDWARAQALLGISR
jgi:hypothetical protein